MKITKGTIILSGNYVEHFSFEKDLTYSYTQKQSNGWSKPNQTSADDSLPRSVSRTKKQLRRIINSNVDQYKDIIGHSISPKFITLTFAENITELNTANEAFTNFLKRFNYLVSSSNKNYLKYVAVPEFQKRGAVHYHIVFFNLERIPKHIVADTWTHGFIDIRDTQNINNLGGYLSKYMSKDDLDTRLLGRKRYFASRNLYHPIKIRDWNTILFASSLLQKLEPQYEKVYDTDYQGATTLKVYNLSQSPEVKARITHRIKQTYESDSIL